MLRCLGLLTFATALVAGPAVATASDAAADTRVTITMVNIEYEGTKVWVPGTFAVKKGTTVTLRLVNNVPSGQHGFSIPAYDVALVVDKGTPATAEFTADREGIFPIICHLHPAHIGGQLIVLP